MKNHVALAGLAVALCWGCNDPTGPRPGLNLVQGGDASDTVGTRLNAPLTVVVLDSHREPIPGVTVYFGTGGPVLVSPLDDPSFVINRLPVITDAQGQAAAWVQFKTAAGSGNVVVSANAQELRFQYQVLPGAPAHVQAEPRDTTLYVGGTVQFRPYITDAYGNRRSDTPAYQYQSLNSGLTITASDQATGIAIGRGLVTIAALSFIDTLRASVVPTGRIFAQAGAYIIGMNLDGSRVDTIPGIHGGRSPDWSPVNHTFVMDGNGLLSMDTTGQIRQIITDPLMRSPFFPRYAPDGSQIYFTGNDSVSTCYGVWRVHPNGTGLEQVVADTLDCGPYAFWNGPSPTYASSVSPDGTQLVYASRTLRIRTLATGVDTSLAVVGDLPRWSPTGEWIAYDSLEILMLIHPDGSGRQALVHGTYEAYGTVAWSPDGQWLLHQGDDRLVLVRVPTGLQLPLAVTIGLVDPIWQR